MQTRWLLGSVLVIIASPVMIGLWDLFAYWKGGNDATISRISLQTAYEAPGYQSSICFLFGLLVAHLFAPLPGERPLPPWLSLLVFVGLPLAVAFGSLFAGLKIPNEDIMRAIRPYPLISVLIWINLGAVVGAAFLPQTITLPEVRSLIGTGVQE